MSRKTSLNGLMEILFHEAIVTNPYKDSVGVWTVGVGHTAAAGDPKPRLVKSLTLEECIDVFLKDIVKYEKEVSTVLSEMATQAQFDAAVSFHFNTGAISRAKWVERFNMGDEKGAISAIMNWKTPPEIIPRRQKEQALFARGTYSNDGKVSVYPASNNGVVLWSKGKRVDAKSLLSARVKKPSVFKPVTESVTKAVPVKGKKQGVAAIVGIVLAVVGFIVAKITGVL